MFQQLLPVCLYCHAADVFQLWLPVCYMWLMADYPQPDVYQLIDPLIDVALPRSLVGLARGADMSKLGHLLGIL